MSNSLKAAWESAKDIVFARRTNANGLQMLNPMAQLWHAKYDWKYGDCRELAQIWAFAITLGYAGVAAAICYGLKDPAPKVEYKMQQQPSRNNTPCIPSPTQSPS